MQVKLRSKYISCTTIERSYPSVLTFSHEEPVNDITMETKRTPAANNECDPRRLRGRTKDSL